MLDFSINTSFLGPAKELLKDNLSTLGKYPDHLNSDVISLLSSFLNVPEQSLAFGVGSTQFFFDIPKLIPYERAVVIAPTFWEYEVFNTKFNKKIKKIVLDKKNDFAFDFKLIQK